MCFSVDIVPPLAGVCVVKARSPVCLIFVNDPPLAGLCVVSDPPSAGRFFSF